LQKEKLRILKRTLGSSYRSGDELLFACPKCKHHKKKLSVNMELDKFKCWVCEYAGRSVRALIRSYGNSRLLNEWDALGESAIDLCSFENIFEDKTQAEENEKVSLPLEFETLTGKTSSTASPAKKYLFDRGLTQRDIVQWKIGYCTHGDFENRVVVPSFSIDGDLNYFIARSYNGNWKKYMNPPVSRDIIFNELMIDWKSDIIIVEGVFDAIIAGTNSIPLLGSQLRENSKLFQQIISHGSKVFFALDPDVEKKSAKMIKKMLTYGVEVAKIEIKPYSDVGEMSKEEFQKRKETASSLSTSFRDYFSYLLGHTVKI